jgi:hypothetical protein
MVMVYRRLMIREIGVRGFMRIKYILLFRVANRYWNCSYCQHRTFQSNSCDLWFTNNYKSLLSLNSTAHAAKLVIIREPQVTTIRLERAVLTVRTVPVPISNTKQ